MPSATAVKRRPPHPPHRVPQVAADDVQERKGAPDNRHKKMDRNYVQRVWVSSRLTRRLTRHVSSDRVQMLCKVRRSWRDRAPRIPRAPSTTAFMTLETHTTGTAVGASSTCAACRADKHAGGHCRRTCRCRSVDECEDLFTKRRGCVCSRASKRCSSYAMGAKGLTPPGARRRDRRRRRVGPGRSRRRAPRRS